MFDELKEVKYFKEIRDFKSLIIFVYVKLFVRKFLQQLQSFHFSFKITIAKMRNFCSRLPFH